MRSGALPMSPAWTIEGPGAEEKLLCMAFSHSGVPALMGSKRPSHMPSWGSHSQRLCSSQMRNWSCADSW